MPDYLPPEVFMDIIMRLPVDSILRCTSVSKLWYSLITSPTFISIHLSRSISQNINTPKLLLRHCVNNDGTYSERDDNITEKYSIHSDNLTFDQLSATFTIPFNKACNYYRIIGISNGLLCLSDDNMGGYHYIFLWNPHIYKFIELPYPIVTYQSHGGFEHALGFAFTPSSNDYKVVRAVYLFHDRGGQSTPLVELYELSTGCWRSINADSLYPYVIHWRNPQAVLNGTVHWAGYRRDSRAPIVVAFNMESEVFVSMGMPHCVKPGNGLNCSRVSVYKDSLCVLDRVRSVCVLDLDRVQFHCNVWVMEEYGKDESWTKKFTIDLGSRFRKPFASQGNGSFLMAGEREDLVSYDPSTRQTKRLGVHGYQNCEIEANTFFADSFVESLVLLGSEKSFRDASIVLKEGDEV